VAQVCSVRVAGSQTKLSARLLAVHSRSIQPNSLVKGVKKHSRDIIGFIEMLERFRLM